jgi:two-component system, OmpR family, response regulator
LPAIDSEFSLVVAAAERRSAYRSHARSAQSTWPAARVRSGCYMKILVIEDDPQTAQYLAKGLRQHGHAVELAANGRDGLFLAAGEKYDVMIVDRMLPGLDGLALVKTVRGAGVRTPILLLTTLGGVDDRVEGLEAGSDDYLVKPFAFAELLARVNALARRPPIVGEDTALRVADLEMDLLKRKVRRAGARIELTPLEFKLLEQLMRQTPRVVTRTMLLEQVWGFHFDPKTSVVETHMSRLRGKIDKGFDCELIHTARGFGYALRAPDASR